MDTRSFRDGAKSPYAKYNKRPFNYGPMYSRNPHLRRLGQERAGNYHPEVSNPLYKEPKYHAQTELPRRTTSGRH